MPIDPATGRPAYQQIAADLREQIYARELAPGDKLLSERELVERYGTAHGTVRQALEVLKREGLVVSAQGRGVFVHRQPLIQRLGSTRYLRDQRPAGKRPFQAETEHGGQRADQRVLAVERTAAPAEVATRLNLDEGEQLLVRRHLLLAEGIPVATADSYYRIALAAETAIERTDRIEGGVHAYLADELGLLLDHFTEELRSREPTADEIETLQLRPGENVIRLLRTLYDKQGQPVQVSDQRLAADKYVLIYDLPIS